MTRVDDHLWTAPDAPDWSRFKGELEGLLQSGIAMFASPHAFALYHRERLAVLLSSALFLAAALPLFWTIV